MSRAETLASLLEGGVMAVVRADNPDKIKRAIEAIFEGGIKGIEITMTVPQALELIEDVAKSMGDVIDLGVGSVVDPETARDAINAGARYVVSPIYKPSVVKMAHDMDCPAMPGCFSPTEIFNAHEAGADIIKVFPADMLGMKYFKAIKAPMPQLNVMPTGGVTLTNAGEWLQHGACAVGVGSALVDKKAIAENRFEQLTENARILSASIAKGRAA